MRLSEQYRPRAGRISYRIWLFLVLVIAGIAPASGQNSTEGPELSVFDAGLPRRYRVSLDELHVSSRELPENVHKILKQKDASSLGDYASRLQRTVGRSVSPVLYPANGKKTPYTRRVATASVLVQFRPGVDPGGLAVRHQMTTDGELDYAPGFALFVAANAHAALDALPALRADKEVISAEPQLARRMKPRFVPNDALFSSQWHLQNNGQGGGRLGNDLNVVNVWDRFRGTGINIAVIDDGVQLNHPDLSQNINTAIDWDFLDNDADPSAELARNHHGTQVAGILGARGNNSLGISGIAMNARLVALRLIAGDFSDAQTAAAFLHSNQVIHVKNNSWGPEDTGEDLDGPGPLALRALEFASHHGRNGKGTIFVWAAGNGRGDSDNANYDSFANSIYTIAVTAVTDWGDHASYAEGGSCVIVAGPSGDESVGRPGILTTDISGDNGANSTFTGSADIANRDYTRNFDGTSAATPMVSGVVALMLNANPELGWRDVQEILIRSATKISPQDPQWIRNAAGMEFNEKFGAGMVNAGKAVELATNWVNLPVQTSIQFDAHDLNVTIPDNFSRVEYEFDVTEELRIEHVVLTTDIEHSSRGDLRIVLVSPSGTESLLAVPHSDYNHNYPNWPFMTVRCWGESSVGKWKVRISDEGAQDSGFIRGLSLKIFGSHPSSSVQVTSVSQAEVQGRSNGNGIPEPGEFITKTLVLSRAANQPAQTVQGVLRAVSPGISLINATNAFQFAAGQTTLTSAMSYVYKLSKDSACSAQVEFDHLLSLPEGTRTRRFRHLLGSRNTAERRTNRFDFSGGTTAILDGKTVYLNVPVALSNRVVVDVNVAVRGEHTAVQDLYLSLVHPQGTEVTLFRSKMHSGEDLGVGSCSGFAFNPLIFDNEAVKPLSGGKAPFGGRHIPDGHLSVLYGKPASGNWRLRISDEAQRDEGSLSCFYLELVTEELKVACPIYNNPPDLAAQSFQVVAGQSSSLQLRASDPDGDALTYTVTASPANGTLTHFNSSNGLITYTPNVGFSGVDNFSLKVHDGTVESRTVRVDLVVDDQNSDSDGDGIPNSFEESHGLDPANPADAILDLDADGANNRDEFLAGTNPRDNQSRLRFAAATVKEGAVVLRFQTVAGKVYAVERTLSAGGNGWEQRGAVIQGNGQEHEFTEQVSTSHGSGTYRVRVVLP